MTSDDQNRLVVITNGPAAAQPPPPQSIALAPMMPQPVPGWKAEFTYDGLGRLRIRKDYSNTIYGWWLAGTTWYIYDGNRVIQERNASNLPTVSYTRGLDLSGTLEGAGGIGGLLARSGGYSGGNWTSHAYYHADANGNITCLVDSSQGLAASYRYDAFGNLIAKSGTLADANLYRFSSKEFHVNSGLYYYLYRFYDPNAQRWINRDPLGENGGMNVYEFVANRPVDSVDPFGEKMISLPPGAEPPPGYERCGYQVNADGSKVIFWCKADPPQPLPPWMNPPSGHPKCKKIEKPEDCWGSLPTDVLIHTPILANPIKPVAYEALLGGCLACCNDNFTGNDNIACMANCMLQWAKWGGRSTSTPFEPTPKPWK